jgi:hypothetical protein
MMTVRGAAYLALLAVLCFPIDSNAATMAEYVKSQPDAPVQLTTCTAGIQFSKNRWGTTTATLGTLVDFRNASTKTAVAVLIRFQMSNTMGVVLDNLFEQATGTFSPDSTIRGNHWSETDTWPGLTIMQCSVNRVQFSDGSAWAEPQSAPSPSPSPKS